MPKFYPTYSQQSWDEIGRHCHDHETVIITNGVKWMHSLPTAALLKTDPDTGARYVEDIRPGKDDNDAIDHLLHYCE